MFFHVVPVCVLQTVFLSGQIIYYCAKISPYRENAFMKLSKFFILSLMFFPCVGMAAQGDFMMAVQLLSAAKNADVSQVQNLINRGANVNYVDATGVSIVCTALMNNDTRAVQILQMYGADASRCDTQIKQYNVRNNSNKIGGGGFFSGLSSAQSLSLAAVGVGAVVGGLFLLTDVFDPGNDNDSSSSGGTRPGGGSGGDSDAGGKSGLYVAYGPAYLLPDGKIDSSSDTYNENLLSWNPSEGGVREWDFNYFRTTEQPTNNFLSDGILVPVQNYLLMMHGYSAFANGYLGQTVYRDGAANQYKPILRGNTLVSGQPAVVALVTENGLNPAGSADRAEGIDYMNDAGVGKTVDKYFNYNNPVAGVLGTEKSGFDLSGSGTAMNPFASAYDSALGKIVAGWESGGRSYGDLYGLVPNAQLAIYKTGGGQSFVDVENPLDGDVVGNVVDGTSGVAGTIDAGDTLTLNVNGVNLTFDIANAVTGTEITRPTITVNDTTYYLGTDTPLLKGTCTGENCDDVSDIAIYRGTDGYYYVNTSGGNTVDSVYVLNNTNDLYVQKTLNSDGVLRNFQALDLARTNGATVLANVDVNDNSRTTHYLTVNDMPAFFALNSGTDIEDFQAQINLVYNDNSTGTKTQGAYFTDLITNKMMGGSAPVIVMPAGEFEYGVGAGKSLTVLDATFENYAPLLEDATLNQKFMTVVAVMHSVGTSDADTIAGYGNGTSSSYGPLILSMWQQGEGEDAVMYSSRKCGIAGKGQGGIDPWCFASAGATAEMATASAAGAFASLQTAFSYMSNPQIYQLMALTADGYLLGTDALGNAFTEDTLADYLKGMYQLPLEYNQNTLTSKEFLNAFADVFGYGLINLERAMTPGKSIYFFDGYNIVSANGNAYWRAATNTKFRPSGVLNLSDKTISAPFYDVIESVDGTNALPRIWENEFAFGSDDKHGLYMGDVLGDLKVTDNVMYKTAIGDIEFAMSVSERMYYDNMNGLDNLSLNYKSNDWNFGVSYQHYLTDGASRFNGMSNPVLGLMSNAVVSDVNYNLNNVEFGMRMFSGAITDEGLLENDPTISAQYVPAKLGGMYGAQSDVVWHGNNFDFGASVGVAHETDTLLGAYTDGLLNLGAGDTTYVELQSEYRLTDDVIFNTRAMFAQTKSDASGNFILGMSDIESNSFAIGAKVGNFELSVLQPLAITDGNLKYAYAKYDVISDENGKSELNVIDTRIASLDLKPDNRELRFVGSYRHNLGQFTDMALGFIYRVNPNHTDKFGDESIFMFKLSHKLGI